MRYGWLMTTVSVWQLTFAMFSEAGTKTWDGKYDTSEIAVTVVYFVPADRRPLIDWRERVDYFCRRMEQFHQREFQGQSRLKMTVHQTPLISALATRQLRQGNGDAIFFRTLGETDQRLKFAEKERIGFPILLVLSDINWQPLDDFYRLKPAEGSFVFEGQLIGQQHFPGAAAGGARATYLADRGTGWGLVSADGWRVPYRGSDCVIYHEGCGHTVGLPHPEPADDSVMSLAQYRGWISESSVNREQKIRLGWEPAAENNSDQLRLFSAFTAIPSPPIPKPGEAVSLALTWPDNSEVKSLRIRFQTSIDGPWIDVSQTWDDAAPKLVRLGMFERETPISYRVDAVLKSGATAELWGYLQVRQDPEKPPMPLSPSADLIVAGESGTSDELVDASEFGAEIDLLNQTDPEKLWAQGAWTKTDGKLLSPKLWGSRLQLPYSPPAEYRLTAIVEPLDEPNGLILGQRCGGNRFVTLFSFAQNESHFSAIENIDGRNVGNETTLDAPVFRRNQLSQVVVIVRRNRITMSVDGKTIVRWDGSPTALSLSDYWATPDETAMFVGAYDCRYRFHRLTLQPIAR